MTLQGRTVLRIAQHPQNEREYRVLCEYENSYAVWTFLETTGLFYIGEYYKQTLDGLKEAMKEFDRQVAEWGPYLNWVKPREQRETEYEQAQIEAAERRYRDEILGEGDFE